MATPLAPLRGPGGGLLRGRTGRAVRNHAGNAAAPPAVPGPGLLDTARLLEWQGSENEDDRIALPRDWTLTVNGPQHRVAFVRHALAWHMRPAGLFPEWQPAVVRVQRVYRKGTTGGLQRVLVLETERNTNAIRAGDKAWLYLVGPDFAPKAGGGSAATSLDLGGASLALKSLLTVTGCTPSPAAPATGPARVEITYPADLPAVDWTPPAYAPDPGLPSLLETRLLLVHHSFWADEATKRARTQVAAGLDALRFGVLPAGGSVVVAGLRRLPRGTDWTGFANATDQTLAWDLYAKEQAGLAEVLGGTDTLRLAVELEDAPSAPWTDEVARADTDLPDPAAAIGLRRALVERMMPAARAAWGNARTLVAKAGGGGSLARILDWDIDNDATWGGLPNLLGNRDASHSFAPADPVTGRILSYEARADCDRHADVLVSVATAWRMKGSIVVGFGAPNTELAVSRGLALGRLHTACAARGIPVAYRDMADVPFAAAAIYGDVPGAEGVPVQALDPALRQLCGRSGRSS